MKIESNKKGCDAMEEIKKILPTISINTLNSKPIRIKENVFIGDSVKIPLLLSEGDELKQLHEGCTVEVLYSDLEGKEVKQQTENITIDTVASTLSFIPEDEKLIVGVNKIQICIKDLDEQIYLAPLILNVLATIDNTVINNETNIQTLYELQKYIDNANATLDSTKIKLNEVDSKIDQLITDMSEADELIKSSVNDLQIEVREALVNANTQIDTSLQVIEEKINGKFEEFNSNFSKITKLEAYLNENNKVCFRSDFINIPAKELVNYSFMVHVNTSPYVDTICTSYIGILTFSLESHGVVCNLNTLSSKSIQGNSVSVAVQFSNGSNTIANVFEYGYKIILTSNGIKSALDNSSCCLSPLTTGGLI